MNNYSLNDVTVVVIGRNEALNLPRCFESIQKITNNIIFVDSGSTDDSVKIAKNFAVPRIIKLNSNYYSASLGRTYGAKKCETALIQFLDGDMELAADWIHDAINFMNKNSKVAVVHGYKHEYKQAGIYTVKADTKDWRSDYLQGAYLIRHGVYDDAGGLDPRFPGEEERDLYVRIHHLKHEVWYIHKLMASHYDFKIRGWRYLVMSDVAGAVFVPMIKSLVDGKVASYIYVYRRLLPILFADIISIISVLTLSAVGLGIFFAVQTIALIYAIKIGRLGYFIIWKSGFLNFHRTIRILIKDIRCTAKEVNYFDPKSPATGA